ncbi:hypothetical protein [Natronomonas sp.]|uniref:hypothetical protein n=1 Tax=Natronomonas sp. TaxID=2184060 RepID=UPI002FC2826B
MTTDPTIVVGIKQVPDDEVRIDPDTGRLDRSSAPAVLNGPDRNALEAALQLRDEVGGCVVAMTMGPPPAAEVLEVAVVMGSTRTASNAGAVGGPARTGTSNGAIPEPEAA